MSEPPIPMVKNNNIREESGGKDRGKGYMKTWEERKQKKDMI